MIGSTGERVLRAALPHVDAWNTWFDWFGNTPEGFARGNATITAACEAAGRDPAEVRRSACVLVRLDPTSRERPDDTALTGPPSLIADRIHAFGAAGADEVIVVMDPSTEASIDALGAVLPLLD
jgi:alkanesulfonate monooxygenase SsuD/methylene tetrahydromethanopterin reductase-like flavin-dependent oxidoreductase (luciferase family)